MSFPRYPEYKGSGNETVGAIPAGWTPTRLRFLLQDGYSGLKIGPFGSQLTSEMLVDGGPYKVYGQENVIANDFIRGSRYIDGNKFQELSVYEVDEGDLLITMMGTSGRCHVVPINAARGIMDSHLLRMRVTQAVCSKFVRLLIDEAAYVGMQIELAGKGSIMHGLNSSIVKNLLLFVPPINEQNQILAFLDRETTKIDVLVAEQRRLMELLKEKRQTVISHAVTRGLNPSAAMKPSGIEWLGDVPEHWSVTRMANIFREVSQSGNDDLPILSVSIHRGVSDKEMDDEELDRKVTRSEDRTKYKRVSPDDLVYNMMRAWQGGFGTVQIEGMVSPAYVVARPKLALVTAYVEHLLRTPKAIEQMRRHSRGITDFRLRLYWDEFKNLSLVIPPIDEAKVICEEIGVMDEQFDTLTAEAQCAIDLLQERRTALISAAVTGQIDVRELIAVES